jgi:hypothetical protein
MARIGDGLLTHRSVGSLFKRDDDHDSDDDCVVESAPSSHSLSSRDHEARQFCQVKDFSGMSFTAQVPLL